MYFSSLALMPISRRHETRVTFHEEIDGGPKTFDRLPMSTDSLTILQRAQHRKRQFIEEEENQIIELGSGIRRLITSKDPREHHSMPDNCEHDGMKKTISLDRSLNEKNDPSARTTTSIDRKSYNASAHAKQKDREMVFYPEKEV